MAIVAAPIGLRHQRLDVAPDHIVDFVTEDSYRRQVDGSDGSGDIDGNDAVQNIVENRLQPGFGVFEIVPAAHTVGHVRRELDHLSRHSVRPQDRVVTGFYPDCIALLINARELPGLIMAGPQFFPKFSILDASLVFLADKYTVMFTN